MRKYLLAFTLLVATAWAANLKLYLKDGNFHLVREYKVESDRVRYYSVERSEWEEMPLELVDLKRTESEIAERQAALEKDAKVISEEEKVERDLKRQVAQIPQESGVYWIEGKQTRVIKAAEATVHTNKGRSVLQKLSPIPAVSGKATLELQGAHSEHVFDNGDQEFFIQLSETERFGIAKLTPKGAIRIVENLTYMPVTKELLEEPTMVETFQQQLTSDGLYKIWSKEPLPPGEYAVVEYTENKLNIQVYDFAIKAKP
ncbi:MAG TPA: hypothetical protein VKU19_17225 [Bryobacteraceae bacterium]|nr:hypothetical protein [Bryobacteraceae bacterium]